ncbi:MAG TPA: sugar phosphate nucleotidyltransferase [Thermoanaerobaculales bacterium]|nr:sugar phosphate nucleotidyltransferase [Thermoanaerobaculales bacterium]HQL28736.1 sugar phosphate nucleotidyltransferase [Thermoanaerobaculales bacterium]
MSRPTVSAAMVLAAGRGERMRPLSDVLPKPALPLPDGPVVSAALRLAAAAGAPNITVNLWHLADRMEHALRGLGLEGTTIVTSREETLMGTAGGLALARSRGLLGRSGPLLVVNGDCLLSLDLGALLERGTSSDDLVTLALMLHPDPRRWSRVVLGAPGKVGAMLPPGPPAPDEVPFLYPGVMVVSRQALDALPVQPGATPDALWEPARAAGRLGGVVVSGRWREVGSPSGYLTAALDQLAGRSAIDPTASVDPGAALRATFAGNRARVAAGAVVEESVLACGAAVGRGARVSRSVLLGPVEVGEGAVLTDQLLAAPLPLGG